MSIILILAAILLLFLAWLLLSPIRLKIDTHRQIYLLQWCGIGRIQLLPVTGNLLIQLQVFFWKKNFYPPEYRPKKKPRGEAEEKKKKGRKTNFQKYSRRSDLLYQHPR